MSKNKTASRKPEQAADEARVARLTEVARLAQIFVDGDQVGQLFSEQGRAWTNGDDIDYNHAPFIAVKKTVLRLERCPADGQPVYVNVWRQRPDDPTKGEVALAGMKSSPLGRATMPLPKALRAAVLNQRVGQETHADGSLSVFAPLYDSLHHVIGAVEVFDDPGGLNMTP